MTKTAVPFSQVALPFIRPAAFLGQLGMRRLFRQILGLGHAEAGAVLGVSESTISWRLHMIRKHMSRQEVRA